jgi:ABC-2 type transport system permease protein
VPWSYLWLIGPALLTLLVLTAGLTVLLSAVSVYARDIRHLLELVLLAWFWMTPIVYPFMTIGSRGGWQTKLYMCNPITPVVLVFQRALYAKTSDGPTQILPNWSFGAYSAYLGLTFGVALVVLAIGISVFGRLEANFAEEL